MSSWTPVEIPFLALSDLVFARALRPLTSYTPLLAPVLLITETKASPLASRAIELRYEVQRATHCQPAPGLAESRGQRSRPRPKEAA